MQEFLEEYNPMLKVPEEKVTRWHQSFDVDAVPDIPAVGLPKPPEVKTFSTAKDVLGTIINTFHHALFCWLIVFLWTTEQAHNLAQINPRLEAALKERLVMKDAADPPEEKKVEAPVNAGLKGVSQSLIDKV